MQSPNLSCSCVRAAKSLLLPVFASRILHMPAAASSSLDALSEGHGHYYLTCCTAGKPPSDIGQLMYLPTRWIAPSSLMAMHGHPTTKRWHDLTPSRCHDGGLRHSSSGLSLFGFGAPQKRAREGGRACWALLSTLPECISSTWPILTSHLSAPSRAEHLEGPLPQGPAEHPFGVRRRVQPKVTGLLPSAKG